MEPHTSSTKEMIALMPHQTAGVEFLRRHNWRGLLYVDPGLGKTYTALEAVKAQGFPKTLIVVPASLKNQWKEETEKYLGVTPIVIDGTPLERSQQWVAVRDGSIAIANAEGLLKDYRFVSAHTWGCVVVDECQKMKNPAAKQTKAIKKLLAYSRIAMSGTPAPNALHELWSVIDWLHPEYLGKNFFQFKQLWCTTHPVFPSKIVSYRDEGKLRELLSKYIYRVCREDVSKDVDLPELTTNIIYVELSEREREIYNTIRDELIIEFENAPEKTITVVNAVGKILRLRQFVDCPSVLGFDFEGSKEKALNTWLRQKKDRTLVFTEWAKFCEHQSRKGLEFISLTGADSQQTRIQKLQAFGSSEGASVLFATSAGETGLNLQHTNSVCHYSLPWNWARYEQRNARCHRKGQTRPVTSTIFLAKGTMDEKIWELVQNKKKLNDSFDVLSLIL